MATTVSTFEEFPPPSHGFVSFTETICLGTDCDNASIATHGDFGTVLWQNATSVVWGNRSTTSVSGLTNGSRVAVRTSHPAERVLWQAGFFGIGGTCVCSVGILCNLTAILVLAHYGTKSSAPFLLICLAVSDSLYLISMLFLEVIPSMAIHGFVDDSYRGDALRMAYCLFYPVSFMSQLLAVHTVMVITLERYIVVAWPFLAHKFCSLRSAMLTMAGVLAFNLVYHVPYYIAYRRDYMLNPITNTTVLRLVRTEFGASNFYVNTYFKVINPIVTFAIPFLVLLVFNSLMLWALKRNSRIAAAKNRAHSEHRLTIMVLCMTGVFFILELLAAISFVLVTGYNKYRNVPMLSFKISVISKLGLLLNSSINFAVYCASGRKFRETFQKVLVKYLYCRRFRSAKLARLCCGGKRGAAEIESGTSSSSLTKVSFLGAKKTKRVFGRFYSTESQRESSSGCDTALTRLSREEPVE